MKQQKKKITIFTEVTNWARLTARIFERIGVSNLLFSKRYALLLRVVLATADSVNGIEIY